jgi:hypothetical protein
LLLGIIKANGLLPVLLCTFASNNLTQLHDSTFIERCISAVLWIQGSARLWMLTIFGQDSGTSSACPKTSENKKNFFAPLHTLSWLHSVMMPRLLSPLLASTTIVETTTAETSTTRCLRGRKIKLVFCCHSSNLHPGLQHTGLPDSSTILSRSISFARIKTQ